MTRVATLLLILAAVCQAQSVVPPASVECATSVDGSVGGVPNPLNPPVTAVGFTGTLPSGNYFVQGAWYDAAGNATLPGPEVQVQLAATGQLQISPPASGMPATAVGMRVYIAATPGSESLQGSTVGSATFIRSVPLSAGTAVPTSDSTVCQSMANDAGRPSGTGYNVTLTTPAGSTVPGYPMQWQLLEPGNSINLGQGLPLYNGTGTHPIPILARPYGHATQSISDGLNLGGSPLIAGAITATSVNGVMNPSLAPGLDIATQINSLIAAMGCGDIVIPAGIYPFSTSIIKPRCINIHGLGAYLTQLQYTASTGWAIISADNKGDGQYPEGEISDLALTGNGQTNPTGAIYVGGSDGSSGAPSPSIDPSGNYGDHQNINRVRITSSTGSRTGGFGTGIQFGNNTWSVTTFESLIAYATTGVFVPVATYTNSGEHLVFRDTSIINNAGIGVKLSAGNNTDVHLVNCSLDFNGSWAVQNGTSHSASIVEIDGTYILQSKWLQNFGFVQMQGGWWTATSSTYLIDNEGGATALGGFFFNGGAGPLVNPAGHPVPFIASFLNGVASGNITTPGIVAGILSLGNQGIAQAASNITLPSGWGTGAATALSGPALQYTQFNEFTITSGSAAFAAAPTVQVVFPQPFPSAPVCSLVVSGVTGSGGAILFKQTAESASRTRFTATTDTGAAFTPAASETYTVLLQCGL